MARRDQEQRQQPIRRAALGLGNRAGWATVGTMAALLLSIAIGLRLLVERAWRGQTVSTMATPAPPLAAGGFAAAKDLLQLPPSAGLSYRLSPDGRWLAYTALR